MSVYRERETERDRERQRQRQRQRDRERQRQRQRQRDGQTETVTERQTGIGAREARERVEQSGGRQTDRQRWVRDTEESGRVEKYRERGTCQHARTV